MEIKSTKNNTFFSPYESNCFTRNRQSTQLQVDDQFKLSGNKEALFSNFAKRRMSQESKFSVSRNSNKLHLMNATLKQFKRRENVYSGSENLDSNADNQKFLNSYMISELASEFNMHQS
jgi:hypothetical protein